MGFRPSFHVRVLTPGNPAYQNPGGLVLRFCYGLEAAESVEAVHEAESIPGTVERDEADVLTDAVRSVPSSQLCCLPNRRQAGKETGLFQVSFTHDEFHYLLSLPAGVVLSLGDSTPSGRFLPVWAISPDQGLLAALLPVVPLIAT